MNLVHPPGGRGGQGVPALMSLYTGDNADCLTRGRLVCALCVILAYALPMSGLPYVCLDCYLIVIKLRLPMLAHRV